MSYLKKYPFDELKIDRAFVQDIYADENSTNLCKAIIAMAKGMQMKVVAEGVETREQFEFLKEAGAHLIQGYLFSKPVSKDEYINILNHSQFDIS